jgi:thymidylate synthase ThyX
MQQPESIRSGSILSPLILSLSAMYREIFPVCRIPYDMKVTHVGLRTTDAARLAGRAELTPELLAASGARYSRNNEGLEAILSRIDPQNLDKSVDSIFRMIDYGHQSIADMSPVALFLDDISLYLAYYLWTICPTAGGQESSTRYIKLTPDALMDAEELGIPDNRRTEWQDGNQIAFAAYQSALVFWERIAEENPELTRIPRSLQEDSSDKARKTVARMRRNYAFDRARYFLPVGAKTNVMLMISARGWVTAAQHLLSHPLLEARTLGKMVQEELGLATPRLLKHATAQRSYSAGLEREFAILARQAGANQPPALERSQPPYDHPPTAALDVSLPAGITPDDLREDLAFHDNRYAYFGEGLRRTIVRFGWEAVSFAEIRDLNRHRTGTKYCPLLPVGFYHAADQLPAPNADYETSGKVGRDASRKARFLLASGDPTALYYTLLGTQYSFEHVTTADKFLYEAELRTGTGAHYRYALHLHDALALWYQRFPETRGLVLEGSAEPE